jgi:hypothetical protein
VLSHWEFVAKHSIPVLPQSPYLPNLSSPDFFVPPNKMTLKERQLQMILDMIYE